MASRFAQVQFSAEERKRLATDESFDYMQEDIAGRLCDFVHYGKFSGQPTLVNRFLKTLRPELRKLLAGSRDWTYEQNHIDRVDEAEQRAQVGGPAYVYVEADDTLYAIARRYEERGVTVEKLLTANPGIKPERLQIGQKVMLPAVVKPAETECRAEAVHTAAVRGVDYIKLMNQCLAKDRAAMSQFFQLGRRMDGMAAEEYGIDLQTLQKSLGESFFGDCLSHEPAALQAVIRESLVDDMESEPKSSR